MTPEHWQRVKTIFDAALQLDLQPRLLYLRRIATEHPELRQEVESLLSANDQLSADFMDRPAVAALPLEEASPDPLLGRRLGPYQIVERIGAGGMGEVYRAFRADDAYRQEVAIKLVRAHLGSQHVASRFRQERQILANLEHPNITRLLDGGTTQQGVPYLVMELIDGEPIDQYCLHRQLDINQRVRLFIDVCAAVTYAHQRLVIHRDLKPGNILVTPQGMAKLLDFGIAKILESDIAPLPDAATIGVIRLFTPAYASPEQLDGKAISTACDIYSLGVVLYELVTQSNPRELPQLDKTGSPQNGKSCQSRKRLPSDLRNIILMATRPEPQRRYASAEQLATDLTHFLDHLPVIARQDTFSYRVATFVARHTAAVIAGVLTTIALLTSVAVTMNEARVARHERQRSEQRFNDARQVANSLMGEIYNSIKDLPGATPARHLLVSKALQYLDTLSRDAIGDSDLELELARAYALVGDVQGNPFYANLGEPAEALVSYRKAFAIRQRVAAANPGDANLTRLLSGSFNQIGGALSGMRDPVGALANYRDALRLLEGVDANSSDPKVLDQFAGAYFYVATAALDAGDVDLAISCIHSASKIRDAILADPLQADVVIRTHSAGDHATAARILKHKALYSAALDEQQKAIKIMERLASENPGNATTKTFLGSGTSGAAQLQQLLGRTNEAEQTYRRAQELLSAVLAADPANVHARVDLTDVVVALAAIETQQSRTALAMQDLQRALTIVEPLRAEKADRVGLIYLELGRASEAQARHLGTSRSSRTAGLQSACDWYRQSVATWDDLRKQRALDVFETTNSTAAVNLLGSCRM